MELDPDSGIEKEYRMAGSAVWVWRCLRLVSRTYLEKLQNVTHTDGEDGIKVQKSLALSIVQNLFFFFRR